jgi:hypothetical protein
MRMHDKRLPTEALHGHMEREAQGDNGIYGWITWEKENGTDIEVWRD